MIGSLGSDMKRIIMIAGLSLLIFLSAHAESYTAKHFELESTGSAGCDMAARLAFLTLEAVRERSWPEAYQTRIRAVKDHHRPVPIERILGGPSPRAAPGAALLRPSETNVSPPEDSVISMDRHAVGPSLGRSSTVGEPSVAVHGRDILYTGNWYAALSHNDGLTFQYIDPHRLFGK